MLYNCLIFLCIGVYAGCNPIGNTRIQTSIWEIQKDFCEIEKELRNHLQHSKETQLDIPTSREAACAKFNLNRYIILLDQSSVKFTQENVATHYNSMLYRLKYLAEAWPAGDDMICPTTPESNLNLQGKLHSFLLQTLPTEVCLRKTNCPPTFSVKENCIKHLNNTK